MELEKARRKERLFKFIVTNLPALVPCSYLPFDKMVVLSPAYLLINAVSSSQRLYELYRNDSAAPE